MINISSSVVFREPPGPIGHGGWGFAYGLAKGAFSRVPGLLNAELGKRGITAYNLEPGFVRSDVGPEAASFPGVPATPPEAIGASVAWLATEPEARKFINKMVHGPELCKSKGLLEANDSQ